MVFGPGELYDIKANQSDSLLHNIKCVLPPRGRPLCTTVSDTFGVKAPKVVLQEKPSVFLCFSFNVKIPSSADKTARIAASTLLLEAAAILYYSL